MTNTMYFYTPETPIILPMPYVTAIASAPPQTTRITARLTLASPTFALRVPVITSATRTEKNAVGIRIDGEGRIIAMSGITAPTRKDAADANAAWLYFFVAPYSGKSRLILGVLLWDSLLILCVLFVIVTVLYRENYSPKHIPQLP